MLIRLNLLLPVMKWYDKIEVSGLGLIASILFLFLSLVTSELELGWVTDFFLMLAGAAFNVVIVLKVIDSSNKRESKRRWEMVKLFTYSQILRRLRTIALEASTLNFILKIDKNTAWDIIQIIQNKRNKQEFPSLVKKLANSIKNDTIIVEKIKGKDPSLEKIYRELLGCFHNICYELDEYRAALAPGVLELIDDEEANIALLQFENQFPHCHRKDNSMKYREGRIASPFMPFFALNDLIVLADLLDAVAILYEIIQQKMVVVPEKSLAEKIVQKVKHWWLPYEY